MLVKRYVVACKAACYIFYLVMSMVTEKHVGSSENSVMSIHAFVASGETPMV